MLPSLLTRGTKNRMLPSVDEGEVKIECYRVCVDEGELRVEFYRVSVDESELRIECMLRRYYVTRVS